MSEERRPIRQKSGRYFVYVFKCGEFYKVGHTDHIRGRLSAVNTSSPVDVELVKYYEFRTRQQARAFEVSIHNLFRDKRVRSVITGEFKEWFKLAAVDLLAVDIARMQVIDVPRAVPERLAEAFRFAGLLAAKRNEVEIILPHNQIDR